MAIPIHGTGSGGQTRIQFHFAVTVHIIGAKHSDCGNVLSRPYVRMVTTYRVWRWKVVHAYLPKPVGLC